MSKETDFWRTKATIDDIAGVPPVKLQACLDAIIPEIAPALETVKGQNRQILEIGSGVGRLTIPIAKKFKDAEVWGLDISDKFIEMALDKSAKVKNVHYIKVVSSGIPYNRVYDAIYTMLTFQHLPHMQFYSYIQDAGLVLKKDGILRFQYVNGDIEHINNYQRRQFTVDRALKDAGLELVKLDEGLVHEQWNWVTAVKK